MRKERGDFEINIIAGGLAFGDMKLEYERV